MTCPKHRAGPSIARPAAGFTMVEALLAIATLALIAAAVSTLYVSGVRSLEYQTKDMLLQSRLRSRMETLVGTPFERLADGSNTVSIVDRGRTNDHTIGWSVTPVDLDGDTIPEADARQVTVFIEERSLTMILVDHKDKVGKL